MENPGTVYKEKVQKQIAENRGKKKEEEAIKEKKLAKAESVEKLMEQIKTGISQPTKIQEKGKGVQLDWDFSKKHSILECRQHQR